MVYKDKEYKKEYYQKNKEKLLKQQREYNEKPEVKARVKKYNKEYRKRNREKIKMYLQRPEVKKRHREGMIVYRKNNLEKLRKWWKEYSKKEKYKITKKKSYEKNKEKNKEKISRKEKERRKNYPEKVRGYFNIYTKKKRKTDKKFNIRNRLRCLFGQALRRYTKTGKIISASKYGVNYKAIIKHLKPFPEDLSKYHIDHIKPLCSFNLENPDEIKKAFAPENHQWLLAHENLSKGKKILFH